MKTTPYFERRRHHHDISLEQVERVFDTEVAREVQQDGHLRIWGYLPEIDRCVRVILLPDGETVHNAFPDSSFTKQWRGE